MSILLALAAGLGFGRAEVPQRGLRLHLRAGKEGITTADGAVSVWRDPVGRGPAAVVPAAHGAPAVAANGGIRFSRGRLLTLDGPLVPPSSRALTVAAVACPESVPGVSILANRSGRVPLVQLDVDEDGLARFIVRDRRSGTLRSVTPAHLGKTSVFVGTLQALPDGRWSVTVQADDTEGETATGPVTMPLIGNTTWVGGLPLGERLYCFDGTVREILVYNRALSVEERRTLVQHLTEKHAITPPPPPVPDSHNVLDPAHERAPVTQQMDTDVCVIGAGSGGIGAAIAAARQGVKVTLVERQGRLGGTGTNAYVSAWEPGPGCSIAEEIYRRMAAHGDAGVATRHPNVSTFSMGQWYIAEGELYERTLKRAGRPKATMACIPYTPDGFDRVVREMLDDTGNVTLLDQTTFFRAEVDPGKTTVRAVLVESAEGTVTRIRAGVVIDATGEVYVCRSAGCEVMLGVDPKSRFGETAAPEKPKLKLNAISRCYTIRPSDTPTRAVAPEPPVARFPRAAHVTGWEDGPRVINPMPMLPGRALIDLGYDECMRRSERVALAHWHWLQQAPEFEGYELADLSPMLGIRESYRVWTEYVLCQADLDAGLPGQTHPDIVAVADHPCDIHGAGGHLTAVTTAYGIPYRCLIPRGDWQNLLVACRGSGFSKIAASSCRLQRTMIQLGHAAGLAAAMAVRNDCGVENIDVPTLVRTLDAAGRYE